MTIFLQLNNFYLNFYKYTNMDFKKSGFNNKD